MKIFTFVVLCFNSALKLDSEEREYRIEVKFTKGIEFKFICCLFNAPYRVPIKCICCLTAHTFGFSGTEH